jgi:hypothetical protein
MSRDATILLLLAVGVYLAGFSGAVASIVHSSMRMRLKACSLIATLVVAVSIAATAMLVIR